MPPALDANEPHRPPAPAPAPDGGPPEPAPAPRDGSLEIAAPAPETCAERAGSGDRAPDASAGRGDGRGRVWHYAGALVRRLAASEAGERISRGLRKTDRALFPRRSANAMVRREAAYHARRDAESSAAAALPTGEEVGLRCVWVTEVYPASHVARLTRALSTLGFTGRTAFLPFDQTEYFAAGRVPGQFLGANNLGYLVPADAHAWSSTSRATALPAGVESVFLTLVNTFPSATVLVAQFRFGEEAARSVEQPFRTPYATRVRREGGVTTIPYGVHLRDDAVERARADLRDRCARWMHERLPGAFAETYPAEAYPTCELLTFTQADPVPPLIPRPADERADEPADEPAGAWYTKTYLEVLDQSSPFDAWSCREMPGLVLRWPRRDYLFRGDRLVLSARLSDLGPRGDVFDADGTPAGATAATWHLSSTIALFASARLVDRYERWGARVRDQLGTVPLDSPKRAVERLLKAEVEIATLVRDALPLSRDVAERPKWVLGRGQYTFVPIHAPSTDEPPLFARMTDDLVAAASRVATRIHDVRATAQALTGLARASVDLRVARTNLRLQRFVAILTIAATLFAALAVNNLPGRIAGIAAAVLEPLRRAGLLTR